MKRIFFTFCCTLLFCLAAFSQGDNQEAEMADLMRDNGKIYVVVAVVLTILAGLILYLVRVDRKLSRLEKNSK